MPHFLRVSRYLDEAELRHGLQMLGFQNITSPEGNKIFKVLYKLIDLDGNDEISKSEFSQFVDTFMSNATREAFRPDRRKSNTCRCSSATIC